MRLLIETSDHVVGIEISSPRFRSRAVVLRQNQRPMSQKADRVGIIPYESETMSWFLVKQG